MFRNLSTINDLLKDYADSNALAKDVVIAGGVNEIDAYQCGKQSGYFIWFE